MKKLLLIGVFFFSMIGVMTAQVGVSTTLPNTSAALDIDVSSLVSKKGLLLPRVSLLNNTDVVTIPSPAVGLMVYNLSNNGVGNAAVAANMFYYWDGVQWTNLTNLSEVKRELLPQVFFVAEGGNGITTPQNTVSGADDINVAPLIIKFSPSSVVLNTGNNLTMNSDNTMNVNNGGTYEVSGFINYNPSIDTGGLQNTTNMEFIIQISSNNGTSWSNIAKTVGVWGAGTTLNSRSNNIPPAIITANKNDLLRCVVQKTQGDNHAAGARISAPTGLQYGKVLKIQKIN